LPGATREVRQRHPLRERLLLVLALTLAPTLPAPLDGGIARAESEEDAVSLTELAAQRRAYLEYWQELGDGGIDGLERFARTVQRVVDARYLDLGAGRPAIRLILDDLVDLFVGPAYELEKRLVMSTPAVLGDDALADDDLDLSGFAPKFRPGEGRLRHFALNAAAARNAPDALVGLAARLRGRDLSASSADSVADLATNRIGRAFSALLRRQRLSELADGETVRDWLVDHFANEVGDEIAE
jgi:hypothetical protein